VISKIESDPSNFFLKERINFRGDTLLHYACAKNNNKLVEYIIKKNPELLHIKNEMEQLPIDLTSDEIIRAVMESRSSRVKV
jgi:ankyrin repeat protein